MHDASTRPKIPSAPRTGLSSEAMNAAWQFYGQSHWAQATKACHRALALDPGCGDALQLLGVLAKEQGQLSEAVDRFKQAVAMEPDRPSHHNNLGVILLEVKRLQEAEIYLKNATNLRPDYFDARSNLGLVLYRQNRFSEAACCFDAVLSMNPDHEASWANLGMTRLAEQRYNDAASAYEKAVALCPDLVQWHSNLGAAYMRTAAYERAAACFGRASMLDPDNPEHAVSKSIALRASGDLSESINILEHVITRTSSASSALAHLVVGLEYTCQWDKLELFDPLLEQATRKMLAKGARPDEDPMLNIRRCDDVSINQAVSRAWSGDIQSKARRIGLEFSHERRTCRNKQITVGYLSYDCRNHPVAHQLFPIFRLHDRSRFKVVVFSMGPDDGSAFRREIESGCDAFIDISEKGLSDAAQCIHDHQVDILVDLMGHSHHNRLEILALRPAPVQIGCLGFLATTGAGFLDYLVADDVVVPKAHDPFYDEKLLRMPLCYQANHESMLAEAAGTRREAWGLPPTGFVYCSFNNVYKIDRSLFDIWMRILHRVPESVLWLNGGHRLAFENMRKRATLLGIDSRRLIMAGKVPLATHLKRLALADLALDTLRYNGGATTANALVSGLPVLTVMGRHWVSRMSASHLIAAGLPDLVCPDRDAYEHAAIELACEPDKLAHLRHRLASSPGRNALFDIQQFVRNLEKGFESAWHRHIRGLEPVSMDLGGRCRE